MNWISFSSGTILLNVLSYSLFIYRHFLVTISFFYWQTVNQESGELLTVSPSFRPRDDVSVKRLLQFRRLQRNSLKSSRLCFCDSKEKLSETLSLFWSQINVRVVLMFCCSGCRIPFRPVRQLRGWELIGCLCGLKQFRLTSLPVDGTRVRQTGLPQSISLTLGAEHRGLVLTTVPEIRARSSRCRPDSHLW